MLDLPDDALVRLTLDGDHAAFAALVGRHARLVGMIARKYRMCLDAASDPEDAAQEIFVRAYVRLATYVPSGRFGAWLGTVATNWCISEGRRRRVATIPDEALPARTDPAPGPEALALLGELGDALATALLGLPGGQADVVLLCCARGMRYSQAADALGVSREAINGRLNKGRSALRAALGAM